MNHKEKLLQAYEKSMNVESIRNDIPGNYQEFIYRIAKNCS
ncbi:hypothetical protein [Lyngbya aestuarii]